jgi:flavin reductase (DIM6/NTAB) family NADH-FMN oxidoreductase RutF
MNATWGIQSDYEQITIYWGKHKTTDNLQFNKNFTVAFATKETMIASDYFGMETGAKINKIEKTGFTAIKSKHVNAPMFEEYPVTIECEVTDMVEETDGYRLVGQVVNVVADEKVLDAKGNIDLGKMNILCYDSVSHSYREIGNIVGQAFHVGLEIKKHA